MFALTGVHYRCLENLVSFKVREYRRLVKVDYKLVIRVLSYGSFNVVALPRNALRHFAVFILSVLVHHMSVLAFDICLSVHRYICVEKKTK